MTDKLIFRLVHPESRRRAAQACQDAQDGHVVTIKPPTRSLDQNSRLWAMLGDVSKQINWYGKQLDSESWKHIFTSSLQKLEVVPNLDGTGFVALGLSTSKMSKRQLGDLMELISAFGAERGVIWSEPKTDDSLYTSQKHV